MSQVWSEINKVVNVKVPFAHVATTSYTTDIVNMENYKKCTFIIQGGAGVANTPKVYVYAGVDNVTCATAIPFKYRTQVAAAFSDVQSALTDATSTGFLFTTATSGGRYIVEVDAADVAAGIAGGDHCALAISTGALGATHTYGILAVLSEPRYPQGILVTAID